MNVIIIGSSLGYQRMFQKAGWEIVDTIKEADLVQFTGGEDVTPSLYGEAKHPQTYCNPIRDKRERIIFNICRSQNKKMAGICRGGQFLNVMCGGRLYQHVDGHAGQKHIILNAYTREEFLGTSTHHQMMISGESGDAILFADQTSSVERILTTPANRVIEQGSKGQWTDVEGVYYKKEQVLCFQPHPEFEGEDALAKIYFQYVYDYLLKE